MKHRLDLAVHYGRRLKVLTGAARLCHSRLGLSMSKLSHSIADGVHWRLTHYATRLG